MDGDIWLAALCASPNLGPVTTRKLLSAFGSAEAVFKAPAHRLQSVDGIGEKRAEGIAAARKEVDSLARKLDELGKQNVRLVLHGGDDYPEALSILGDDAPLVLYIKGKMGESDKVALAMVGSRNHSADGKVAAEQIAMELGRIGFTVVSGMARGIDTVAHRGCLAAGGRSIAVLGCGVDIAYPPENLGLMQRLAESGAVISEFAPGTPPMPENFPRRNRLISGLSLGVLVVEAALKSGSLITARYALEQGKEVFAVPGSIRSKSSQGTNELIKQGAKMVTSSEDIVAELAPELKAYLEEQRQGASNVRASLTDDERAVCDRMSGQPMHVDEIVRTSGLPIARALALLLQLELKGVVKQSEGKKFHLVDVN